MTGKRYLVQLPHPPSRLVFSDADGFNIWLRNQSEIAEMFPNHKVEFTVETEEYQLGNER
jgi:hypothetical protein